MQILKDCNYYISCDNIEEDTNKILVSWDDTGIYYLKWSPPLEAIVSNWHNLCISCPKYAAPIIISLVLKDFCDQYNYPYEFLHFKKNGNTMSQYSFDSMVKNEDIEKTHQLTFIIDDIMNEG